MGTFRFPISVINPTDRAKSAQIEQCLVDTGSESTWVRADILDRLKVPRERRDQLFQMANRQLISRDIGYAIVQVGESATIDEVVFGVGDDQNLLGAHTLEGLRMLVDPHHKRLLHAGPAIAATPVSIETRRRRKPRSGAAAIGSLPPADRRVVAIGTPTLSIDSLVRNPVTGVIGTAPIGSGMPLTKDELDRLAVVPSRPDPRDKSREKRSRK